jgi:hypothetical protein
MKQFVRTTEADALALIGTLKQAGIRNQMQIRLGQRAWIHHIETDQLVCELLRYTERDTPICCVKLEARQN